MYFTFSKRMCAFAGIGIAFFLFSSHSKSFAAQSVPEEPQSQVPQNYHENLPTHDYEKLTPAESCVYMGRNKTGLVKSNQAIQVYLENYCKGDQYILLKIQLSTSRERKIILEHPIKLPYRRQLNTTLPFDHLLSKNEFATNYSIIRLTIDGNYYYEAIFEQKMSQKKEKTRILKSIDKAISNQSKRKQLPSKTKNKTTSKESKDNRKKVTLPKKNLTQNNEKISAKTPIVRKNSTQKNKTSATNNSQ